MNPGDLPIFVVTRWYYQSYTDYWRLVELSGFPTCFVDEVDLASDNVYIVCPLNGEWEPMIRAHADQKKRATLISWTIEPPTQDNYIPNLRKTVDDGLVDYIWLAYHSMAERANHPNIRFVPIGSHAGLCAGGPVEHKYDFTHLSYTTPRRAHVYDALEAQGLSIGPNGWGAERDEVLRRTRFLLNVHQHDGCEVYEPLRFAVAAAYKLPIVSEWCADSAPYVDDWDFYQVEYDDLADFCPKIVKQDLTPFRAAIGQNAYTRAITRGSFATNVDKGLWEL